jgi:hypothetical protein
MEKLFDYYHKDDGKPLIMSDRIHKKHDEFWAFLKTIYITDQNTIVDIIDNYMEDMAGDNWNAVDHSGGGGSRKKSRSRSRSRSPKFQSMPEPIGHSVAKVLWSQRSPENILQKLNINKKALRGLVDEYMKEQKPELSEDEINNLKDMIRDKIVSETDIDDVDIFDTVYFDMFENNKDMIHKLHYALSIGDDNSPIVNKFLNNLKKMKVTITLKNLKDVIDAFNEEQARSR